MELEFAASRGWRRGQGGGGIKGETRYGEGWSQEGAEPEQDPSPSLAARPLYLGQRQVLQPLPILAEDVPREGPPRRNPRLS